MVVALLLVFSFILLLLYFNTNSASASKKKPPPSPFRLPVIGNFHQVEPLAHRSFQSLSKRYGDVMLLHFGSKPVVVASSAIAAREIMKNQDLIFANRPHLTIPEKIFYGRKDVAFAAYGEQWRQARSICMLQLLSTKRVQSFRGIREDETLLMVEKIRQQQKPAVVNLSEMFLDLTNGVISRAALGRKYAGRGEENDFNRILDKMVEVLGTFNVGDYLPWLAWVNRINGLDARMEEVSRTLDEFLEGVLRQYREKDDGSSDDAVTNIADALLQYQRENKDSAPVDDDVLKALILDVISAGTDTTYSALEWTMAELIRNPRTMKLLQKEVREVSRNKGGEVLTEDDVDKMPYLKAVSKESLRLHPPFPLLIPRELTQDTNLLGYDIPRGTQVLINCWAVSRDPSLWENPEEFRPERFFESSIDYKGLHFEMFPFGAGRRGCPGITFAMCEYELALSRLVNEFDFGLPNGAKEEELDMTEAPGVVVHKKFPLLVVATSRTTN